MAVHAAPLVCSGLLSVGVSCLQELPCADITRNTGLSEQRPVCILWQPGQAADDASSQLLLGLMPGC